MKKIIYILVSIFCFMACKNSIQPNTNTSDILWISGIQVDCDNDDVKHCLQIQESEVPYIDEWIPWRDSIVGLTPEFGYMYKVRVQMRTLKNKERLTHKELVEYQLVEVLEKRRDPAVALYDIWGLYSMNEEVLNTSGQRPRLELDLSTHNVRGYAFCNQISGRVFTLDNTIKFSRIGTTRRACKNLESENKFIKLLENTTTFKREKRFMKFYNSKGKEVLAFKKLD